MGAVQMLALVRDTFRESLARKIFWGFLGCSTALILFFSLAMNIDLVEGAMAAVTIFGQDVALLAGRRAAHCETHSRRRRSLPLHRRPVSSVFASAGLIPTVFEPGRIELLPRSPSAARGCC
jgi:hypothetical protein